MHKHREIERELQNTTYCITKLVVIYNMLTEHLLYKALIPLLGKWANTNTISSFMSFDISLTYIILMVDIVN